MRDVLGSQLAVLRDQIGDAQETLCGAGDQTRFKHMQGKCIILYYFSDPVMLYEETYIFL